MKTKRTALLVIGAGPYGIATAAYAKYLGVPVTVVGKTLDFWKTNMPRGMFLRSGPDWHLDARDVATFQAYFKIHGLTPAQVKPVPLDMFLDYASWFMGQYDLTPHPALITHLARSNGIYTATLDDGSQLRADKVVLSLGFAWFKQYPSELTNNLPAGSYTHTCDMVDFEFLRGKRVLIVGGRQSAFEWAALIREKGADEIHIAHRHPTPQFTEPDWSWVQPMVRETLEDHGWWRRSTDEEKEKIRKDFWAVGRLTLEAWLGPRVHQANIHIHENTEIVATRTLSDGTYEISLDDKTTIHVHHIILATGYLPNLQNVAFLDRTTILRDLQTLNGFSRARYGLSNNSAQPVCHWPCCCAGFWPFFGFTVACPVAARIIGDAVAQRN